MSKPKIVLFGMGTLGGGNIGVPVLIDLFERLSKSYDVVFYSFLAIDASQVPKTITVKQPVRWRLPGRVKYLLVALRCLWDHLFNPVSLLFSVSIYPASYWAVVLSKIINRPVVVQLISTEGGTLPPANLGNITIPWLKKVTLWVCRKADYVVTVADYQKKIAQNNLTSQRPLAVLPLRIDTAIFPYQETQLSFPVQFIQIAFYHAIKDQDTMFEAFAKITQKINCHLTVIGEGFNVPKVAKMMDDLHIRDKVTFTGYVDNKLLKVYMKKAHILLHTAVFETGCAVIQEAMASGVVVAGTNVGILSDIGEDYAVIVPPKEPGLLAEKILHLVADASAYERLRINAHQYIIANDAIWSYRNYHSYIENILAER